MFDSLKSRFGTMGAGQRKLLGVMALALALTAGGTLMMRSRGAMTPLYTALAPSETREIAAELGRQGIDCKVSSDETSVDVPVRSEPLARMRLAAAGLPRSAPEKGWEIFGEGGLAVTKPQQRALQIRALQGELGRSIASLESVSKASVHISLKEDSPFLEGKEPAKAAVLLHLKPGAHLGRDQATAIAYLVAKSVPDLETAQITILDEKGGLLFSDNVARGTENGEGTHNMERELERRVQSQLDEAFGLGKTIVRATATLQTQRSEVSRTTYKPPAGAAAGLIAKEQVQSEDYAGAGPQGRAGGQPGMTPNAFGAAGGTGPGGQGSYQKRDTSHDFKVDEEKEVLVKPAGGLERLTLGILVDTALEKDLAKIENVARTAAGINKERGDVLTVESVKFAPSATDSFKSANKMEVVKTVLRLILNTLALVIGLLTLRSIVSALRPGPDVAGTFVSADGELRLADGSPAPMKLIASGDQSPLEDGMAGQDGVSGEGLSPADAQLRAAEQAGGLSTEGRAAALGLAGPAAPAAPPVPQESAEELIGRVETSPVDDIAEVLRHWLEGASDE